MSKKEKQIVKTKESITSALLELVLVHEFEGITITQLCQKAGVGRPTFYRHFDSTNDVFEQLSAKWFQQFLKEARLAYAENPVAETLDLVAFEFFRNNQTIAKMIHTPAFYRLMIRELGVHRRNLEKEFQLFDDSDLYALEYRIGGLVFVFARWMKNGMKESPEDMARVFSNAYRGM